MKFYWTLNQVPELRGLPAAERREIFHKCVEKQGGVWKYALIAVAGGVLGSLLGIYVQETQGIRIAGVFHAAVGSALGAFTGMSLLLEKLRPLMAEVRRKQKSR